jgi:hypothetical protein
MQRASLNCHSTPDERSYTNAIKAPLLSRESAREDEAVDGAADSGD